MCPSCEMHIHHKLRWIAASLQATQGNATAAAAAGYVPAPAPARRVSSDAGTQAGAHPYARDRTLNFLDRVDQVGHRSRLACWLTFVCLLFQACRSASYHSRESTP